MGVSLIRTIILYVIVVIGVRIMGKRQIGELQPTELVITIMISELASIPMQATGIPIMAGVIPIAVLIALEVLLSYAVLKNKRFREILSGKPSILIYDGVVMKNEMAKLRFNNDDLMEDLRLAGCTDVREVQYAILETNGQLSVILKKDHQPLTFKDAKKIYEKKGGR